MLLVFAPVFKWVYGGWLGVRGSLDFAGGTAIHVNAGIAALVAVLILGKRKGWPKEGHPPHSMPLVMIGTGILWFGWFGFNAGSAFGANGQAVQAFMNTFVAAAAAGLAWADRREGQGRPLHQPGCRVGNRGRSRRHHPGSGLRDRPCRRSSSVWQQA